MSLENTTPSLHALANYARKHNMPTQQYRDKLLNKRAELADLYASVALNLPIGEKSELAKKAYSDACNSLTLIRVNAAIRTIRELDAQPAHAQH